jgi:hypothetical protein
MEELFNAIGLSQTKLFSVAFAFVVTILFVITLLNDRT